MKALLAICLFVTASLTWAAPGQAPSSAVKGEVLEVKNVDSYTYLRLKTKGGETWAAVTTAAVKKGESVTIENVMTMRNFESKTLKQTFPIILFGTLGGASSGVGAMGAYTGGASAAEVAAAHPGFAKVDDKQVVRVAKATGANARTVAEILTKGPELKDKSVLVRGQVMKYTPGIMGKNWLHISDGSGSAANGTNDLIVTTTQQAKVSDVVTAKGIVRTNKDFGAGYSYKVLVEEATLQP